MRKHFGLAVVGFAIAFGVASRFASYARENHPLSVPSTLAKQPSVANFNHQKVTAFPTKDNIEVIQTPQSPNFSISSSNNNTSSTGDLYTQTLGEDIPETKDGQRFRRIMQEAIAQKLHQRPMGEIMQAIATKFIGASYKANLLDQSQTETLVVNLHQFDCVLLVETVLAIARGVALEDYSYSTFIDRLRDQRYWHGKIDGYCSRLHYFSQWIYDNEKRENVQNMGIKLRGVALKKKLNFMSTHRQKYPQMAQDDANYQCIVEQEAQLDNITVNYIPTQQVRRIYSQLQPGDIIAVATKITGMDVTHTGLVYRQPSGNLGFIHASPAGKVTIARDLQTYISRVENAIGILVVRPHEKKTPTQESEFSRGF